MQDYGLVSIITSCYNAVDYIAQTIESVQAQTYPHWELLITDDCSTDGSCAVVEKYMMQNQRIKLFHMEQNSGAGAARNNSIKEAKGKYIAFCDSDDRWLPDKLEKQLRLMSEKKAACCHGAYYECDEEGNRIAIVHVNPVLTLSEEKHANQLGMLTGIYDTELVGKHFMPLIRKRQDWAMWLKILMRCKVAHAITEPVAEYRIRSNSISRKKFDLIKYNAAIYEEVFQYPRWLAMLYTLFINIPTYFVKRKSVEKLK